MNKKLRKIIDEQNITELTDFLNENPDVDLNHVTPNGLSALWWALMPPRGKQPSKGIIKLLISSNRIDPNQNYGHTTLVEYSSVYPPIHKIITQYQNDYDSEQLIEIPQNNLNQFINDGQNTHASFVMAAVDKAIGNFYTRYGKIALSPQETSSTIEHWLKTLSTHSEATKLSALLAIKRVLSEVNQTRSYKLPDNKTVSLSNAQVLSLVWVALEDKDPARYVANTGMTEAEVSLRKERLIEHLAMTQNEYGKGKPACVIGTRNQIISCLDQIHVDVKIINTNNVLTKEILIQQYQAFCADQLKQLEVKDHDLFQEYLSSYVLRGLPGGQSEEMPPSFALLNWVETFQKKFKESILSSFKKIEFSLDEELVYLLNPNSDKYPALCHSLFPALEQLNFLASEDSLAPMSAPSSSRSLDILASLAKNQTLTEKIQHLQHYWLQQFDEERLTTWLAKNNLFKTFLAQCSVEEKSTFLRSYWQMLTEKTLFEVTKPSFSSLITYLSKHVQAALPDLGQWVNQLTQEEKHSFFEKLIRLEMANYNCEKNAFILSEALAFAVSIGNIAYFPFHSDITLKDSDFRGINLEHVDLTKVKFQGCDLRLSLITHNQTVRKDHLDGSLVEFTWPWLKMALKHQQTDNLFSDEITPREWLLLAAYYMNQNELQHLLAVKAFADAFCKPNMQQELLHTILLNNHSKELFAYIINHPDFLPTVLVQSAFFGAVFMKETSLLFWITETNQLDLLKIIFVDPKIYANLLDTQNADGNTLLHISDTETITKFFLEEVQGIESLFSVKNNLGESVLHKAIRQADIVLFRSILTSGFCDTTLLTMQNNHQETILHLAVKSEQPFFLNEILNSPHCNSALLEVKDAQGKNCLELALKNPVYFNLILESPHLTREMMIPLNGKLNILGVILYSYLTPPQKLILVQAVLNSPYAQALMQENLEGLSPLYVAVHQNKLDIVQAFLNHPYCTTALLKRQEFQGDGLTPLQAVIMRNLGDGTIEEAFLQSPLCTMDVLKVKFRGGFTCLKSLQQHVAWDKLKPYVEEKNKAFLASQSFMNIEVHTTDGAFVETVDRLRNLFATLFEPLDDFLVPAFQQAMNQYNQNKDIGALIKTCYQALTASESQLKNNRNSLRDDSSESDSAEELMDDFYDSDDSRKSSFSSDSDSSDEPKKVDIDALEMVSQIRAQIKTYELSLIERIKTATTNYLNWTTTHAHGHRFVTRFSHFFHGSSGKARAQHVLNLINDGADYSVLKPILDQATHDSGHRKHSYSRYIHAGINNLAQDDILELPDNEFISMLPFKYS
ncbi:MAG: pentapeptide repeat-containing protein [Legionella sp.]|nr:pentapeptide repeat-containing protein [Legionella sp.]